MRIKNKEEEKVENIYYIKDQSGVWIYIMKFECFVMMRVIYIGI